MYAHSFTEKKKDLLNIRCVPGIVLGTENPAMDKDPCPCEADILGNKKRHM